MAHAFGSPVARPHVIRRLAQNLKRKKIIKGSVATALTKAAKERQLARLPLFR